MMKAAVEAAQDWIWVLRVQSIQKDGSEYGLSVSFVELPEWHRILPVLVEASHALREYEEKSGEKSAWPRGQDSYDLSRQPVILQEFDK